MNYIQFLGAVELGLLYSLIAIGVYFTFRVLDFPDLTVDGSFPLGACVSAALIIKGTDPILASLCAFLSGTVAGLATAFLHLRFRILGLLAGILSMTALYSINLRIMDSPNLALLNETTLFTDKNILYSLGFIVIGVYIICVYFLSTQIGLAMRAAGVNKKVSQSYGIYVQSMISLGLAFSNGLVALAGGLFAQSQGFADISMGTGTIIIGLASVIIGETLIASKKIFWAILACILGSIIYRLTIAFALNSTDLGIKASDLNLITALLITLAMGLPKIKHSLKKRRNTLSS